MFLSAKKEVLWNISLSILNYESNKNYHLYFLLKITVFLYFSIYLHKRYCVFSKSRPIVQTFTSLQTAATWFQLCRYSSQKVTNWTLKVVCEICYHYFYFNILNHLSSTKLYKHLSFLKHSQSWNSRSCLPSHWISLLKGLC